MREREGGKGRVMAGRGGGAEGRRGGGAEGRVSSIVPLLGRCGVGEVLAN